MRLYLSALAEQAGLGWTGKTPLLIHHKRVIFVLGNYFSLPLAEDKKQIETTLSHCGSCRACIHVCPTMPSAEHPLGIMMSMHGCVFCI